MKKGLFCILTVVIIVSFISSCLDSNSEVEDDLPTAEEIIEKYYATTGGKEAYEKIKNKKTVYKINYQASGMEIDFVKYQERSNKNYSLMDMGASGKTKYGSDGKVAWEISPSAGMRVLEGEELAVRLHSSIFDGPDAWKGLYKSANNEGIEDINGKACYKVVFIPEKGPRRINYYDKETFLILKAFMDTESLSGTSNIEVFMEDYKKEGEILSAHKMTRYERGQVIDIGVIKSIETNIEMPQGIFDLPEEIRKILDVKKNIPEVDELFPPITTVAKTWKLPDFELDLSPAKWDPADVRKYGNLNQQIRRDNVLFEGKNGVIVGTTSPPAQRAGLEALQRGGSAMDAALTTSLTNIALDAGAVVSYAGVMELVYYDAAADKYYNLNAAWNTLLEEDDPMTIPRSSGYNISARTIPSGRTALVPGYMAGVEAAHRRFGKLPFSALFTPAIYYAEKGFRVSPTLSYLISMRQSALLRLPETRRIFMNEETGHFYGTGDHFCQPELAITLRAVAHQGVAYMYTGEWTKRLVALIRRDGGKMTMNDLRNYQVIWSEPLKIPYGDYTVYAPGLPAVGGIKIAQALNVAKEAGLSNMGHYSESPEAFFWLFQINNLSFMTTFPEAHRSNLLGGVDSTLASLATKAHAKHLWSLMSKGEFRLTKTPISKDTNHSDAIVAIDQWGNVAALVHTSETVYWGEAGIFVDGVSISDTASFKQRQIREKGPGERLLAGTEPLIISRKGKPFIALASIGGVHEATNSVLFNIMDFKMGLKEAIDAPSLHYPKIESKTPIPQVFYGAFSDELLEGVKKLGLKVEATRTGGDPGPGSVIGAMIEQNGIRKAVPSPGKNGVALGY